MSVTAEQRVPAEDAVKHGPAPAAPCSSPKDMQLRMTHLPAHALVQVSNPPSAPLQPPSMSPRRGTGVKKNMESGTEVLLPPFTSCFTTGLQKLCECGPGLDPEPSPKPLASPELCSATVLQGEGDKWLFPVENGSCNGATGHPQWWKTARYP